MKEENKDYQRPLSSAMAAIHDEEDDDIEIISSDESFQAPNIQGHIQNRISIAQFIKAETVLMQEKEPQQESVISNVISMSKEANKLTSQCTFLKEEEPQFIPPQTVPTQSRVVKATEATDNQTESEKSKCFQENPNLGNHTTPLPAKVSHSYKKFHDFKATIKGLLDIQDDMLFYSSSISSKRDDLPLQLQKELDEYIVTSFDAHFQQQARALKSQAKQILRDMIAAEGRINQVVCQLKIRALEQEMGETVNVSPIKFSMAVFGKTDASSFIQQDTKNVEQSKTLPQVDQKQDNPLKLKALTKPPQKVTKQKRPRKDTSSSHDSKEESKGSSSDNYDSEDESFSDENSYGNRGQVKKQAQKKEKKAKISPQDKLRQSLQMFFKDNEYFSPAIIKHSLFYFDPQDSKKLFQVPFHPQSKLPALIKLSLRSKNPQAYLLNFLNDIQAPALRSHLPLRDGFSIFQVLVNKQNAKSLQEAEERTVLLGMTRFFNMVSEYNHKSNEAIQAFNLEGNTQKFSLTVDEFCGNIVYIQGGINGLNVTDRSICLEFFLLNNGSLSAQMLDFPKMNQPRIRHSTFIEKDYLFVVFGMRDAINYLSTVEAINLRDPKAIFVEFEIPNYEERLFSDAVVFSDILGEPPSSSHTYHLVFGNAQGNQEVRTRHSEKYQSLDRLVIKWRGDKPIGAYMENVTPAVKIQGDIQFGSQWSSKYFDSENMQWYFMDTQGTLVEYSLGKNQIKSFPLASKQHLMLTQQAKDPAKRLRLR